MFLNCASRSKSAYPRRRDLLPGQTGRHDPNPDGLRRGRADPRAQPGLSPPDPLAAQAAPRALERMAGIGAWGKALGRAPRMATLAAFPAMMRRDRRREGLRVCRAAWLSA